MASYHLIILSVFYLIGLILTAIFGFPRFEPSLNKWLIIISIIITFNLTTALIIPRFQPRLPRGKIWIAGGLVAILAIIHFQLRVPHPQANDISKILVEDKVISQIVTVRGKILEQPQVNASNRIRFILAINQVKKEQEQEFREVTGKSYVTLPLLQGNGLFMGRNIEVTGLLYQPKSAKNPGAFDWQNYLIRRGIFSGISGTDSLINPEEKEPVFAFYKIRKIIGQAQLKGLGSPLGQLVTSMVLGRNAVDLSINIRDLFIKNGLAHVLAASGFHVSLLLGLVLKLTKRFSSETQLKVGVIVLIFYVGLTGLQASVCRATLMGFATLLGLVYDRKVNALGSLLVAGILLLIINPLWVWDLGFQLSFLATLGLIVSAAALEKKLDFLFPVVAQLIAVALSASLWVFPLIIYTFKTFPIYSIFVNITTTPFIIVISLGGMISAFFALFYPPLGSLIAQFLYYPTDFLVEIVKFFDRLPYSSFAFGQIPLILMLMIYGIYVISYLNPWLYKRFYLGIIFSLILISMPIFAQNYNLTQITIFQTNQPHIFIENRGKNILITREDYNDLVYNILPFARNQGINKLDNLIFLDYQNSLISNYLQIDEKTEVNQLNYQFKSKDLILDFINEKMLYLTVNQQKWLLLFKVDQINLTDINRADVLIWWGYKINPQLITNINPATAIAVNTRVNQDLQKYMMSKGIKLYSTKEEGAIQWQEKTGFQSFISAIDN